MMTVLGVAKQGMQPLSPHPPIRVTIPFLASCILPSQIVPAGFPRILHNPHSPPPYLRRGEREPASPFERDGHRQRERERARQQSRHVNCVHADIAPSSRDPHPIPHMPCSRWLLCPGSGRVPSLLSVPPCVLPVRPVVPGRRHARCRLSAGLPPGPGVGQAGWATETETEKEGRGRGLLPGDLTQPAHRSSRRVWKPELGLHGVTYDSALWMSRAR